MSFVFDQFFQVAVELINVQRHSVFIGKNLVDEFLLLLLVDKSTFNPESFVSHLLAAVVRDLLVPLSVVSLDPVPLDLLKTTLKRQLTNLPDFPLFIQQYLVDFAIDGLASFEFEPVRVTAELLR